MKNKAYVKAISDFKSRKKLAEIEIFNYKEKFVVDKEIGFEKEGISFTDDLIFAASSGLFIWNVKQQICHKLLDGKFYGITRFQDWWLVSRSNNKGFRNHIKNERISDIVAIRIENYRIVELKVILWGIPGEVHQIDSLNGVLFVPHTDYNEVLTMNLQLENPPVSIMDCKSMFIDIEVPSHLNSLFIFENILHLIAHNFTMYSGKFSDLVKFDLERKKIIEVIPLYAHSAHNIYVTTGNFYYCDSNNKILYKNGVLFFKADKLLRGLSVTTQNIFVGGSDICFDTYKRFSGTGTIYNLSIDGELLGQMHFPEIGNIYEIRCFSTNDLAMMGK